MKLLSFANVDVHYGQVRALDAVSFTVPAGSVLAVVGPNGAGKSTIARVLSGLVPVTAGRIELAGEDISPYNAERIRRAGVVHLPEGRGVFPTLSVHENLRMAALTLPRAFRAAAIERGYDIFAQLANRRRQQAGTLSGGEQQMLSLARALIVTPRLIVADELSLGLAPKMVDVVFDNLLRAHEAGVAIVLIEQYVHRALAIADRCLVMRRGSVAWFGDSTEAKEEVVGSYLGDAT